MNFYLKLSQVGCFKVRYKTNPLTSSQGAAITTVVPTFCVKRSFSMQSSASLTNLSTLFDETVVYRAFENACDGHV